MGSLLIDFKPIWDTFWGWCNAISIFAGIVTAIISFRTWLIVRSERNRLKQYQTIMQARIGTNPAVFIVNALPDPIENHVRHFMASHDELSKVPEDMIVSYTWDKKRDLTADDLDEVYAGIRAQYAELRQKGYDKLALFYGGPATVAAMLGALLSNSRLVRVYQLDRRTKQYEDWGLLEPRVN